MDTSYSSSTAHSRRHWREKLRYYDSTTRHDRHTGSRDYNNHKTSNSVNSSFRAGPDYLNASRPSYSSLHPSHHQLNERTAFGGSPSHSRYGSPYGYRGADPLSNADASSYRAEQPMDGSFTSSVSRASVSPLSTRRQQELRAKYPKYYQDAPTRLSNLPASFLSDHISAGASPTSTPSRLSQRTSPYARRSLVSPKRYGSSSSSSSDSGGGDGNGNSGRRTKSSETDSRSSTKSPTASARKHGKKMQRSQRVLVSPEKNSPPTSSSLTNDSHHGSPDSAAPQHHHRRSPRRPVWSPPRGDAPAVNLYDDFSDKSPSHTGSPSSDPFAAYEAQLHRSHGGAASPTRIPEYTPERVKGSQRAEAAGQGVQAKGSDSEGTTGWLGKFLEEMAAVSRAKRGRTGAILANTPENVDGHDNDNAVPPPLPASPTPSPSATVSPSHPPLHGSESGGLEHLHVMALEEQLAQWRARAVRAETTLSAKEQELRDRFASELEKVEAHTEGLVRTLLNRQQRVEKELVDALAASSSAAVPPSPVKPPAASTRHPPASSSDDDARDALAQAPANARKSRSPPHHQAAAVPVAVVRQSFPSARSLSSTVACPASASSPSSSSPSRASSSSSPHSVFLQPPPSFPVESTTPPPLPHQEQQGHHQKQRRRRESIQRSSGRISDTSPPDGKDSLPQTLSQGQDTKDAAVERLKGMQDELASAQNRIRELQDALARARNRPRSEPKPELSSEENVSVKEAEEVASAPVSIGTMTSHDVATTTAEAVPVPAIPSSPAPSVAAQHTQTSPVEEPLLSAPAQAEAKAAASLPEKAPAPPSRGSTEASPPPTVVPETRKLVDILQTAASLQKANDDLRRMLAAQDAAMRELESEKMERDILLRKQQRLQELSALSALNVTPTRDEAAFVAHTSSSGGYSPMWQGSMGAPKPRASAQHPNHLSQSRQRRWIDEEVREEDNNASTEDRGSYRPGHLRRPSPPASLRRRYPLQQAQQQVDAPPSEYVARGAVFELSPDPDDRPLRTPFRGVYEAKDTSPILTRPSLSELAEASPHSPPVPVDVPVMTVPQPSRRQVIPASAYKANAPSPQPALAQDLAYHIQQRSTRFVEPWSSNGGANTDHNQSQPPAQEKWSPRAFPSKRPGLLEATALSPVSDPAWESLHSFEKKFSFLF